MVVCGVIGRKTDTEGLREEKKKDISYKTPQIFAYRTKLNNLVLFKTVAIFISDSVSVSNRSGIVLIDCCFPGWTNNRSIRAL